jgi:CDP-diacylglycerol--glycerol-3-phosphate 3-phosphatidyltransferase
MKRHVPNALTFSRLVMAVVMFAFMAAYEAAPDWGPAAADGAPGVSRGAMLLDLALVTFLLAGVTDVLDGYFARRFSATSALGRISDPFIDKVLVCGAFAYFAGASFVVYDGQHAVNISGVATWMAVVIFAREILVTGIRGYSERQGKAFATTVFGKSKMALQSASIAWILFFVAHGRDWGAWARVLTDVLVWTTVAVTVLTAFVYVNRTRRLLAAGPGEEAGRLE